MRVKCLAQEHNTMSPRARTRTGRSGGECTNLEATACSLQMINLSRNLSILEPLELDVHATF